MNTICYNLVTIQDPSKLLLSMLEIEKLLYSWLVVSLHDEERIKEIDSIIGTIVLE
jgi:hypothetical protein